MLPYTKEDIRYGRNLNIIGMIVIVIISAIFGWNMSSMFVAIIVSSFIAIVIIFGIAIHCQKRIQNRINRYIQEGLMTLNYDPLREEVSLIEKAYKDNPKKMRYYALPLFSAKRLTGGSDAGEYLEPAKKIVEKHKRDKVAQANFTIELCHYYLTINDVEMFLLNAKTLKSFPQSYYEMLVRKLEKVAENINPTEHKELLLLEDLYKSGPDDEKIVTLLSSPYPLYKVIYTYYIMKFYESRNEMDKVLEYKNKLNNFEGNVYPLKRKE